MHSVYSSNRRFYHRRNTKEQAMNTTQKEILRDCFEGCMSLGHALVLIADPMVNGDAVQTWARWSREMDEEGYYTF